MGWVRLDDGLHDHRKFTRLTDIAENGLEELAAVGLWTYCRTWAARHPRTIDGRKTAGVVTRGIVRRFAGDSAEHLAALLVKAELWAPVDDGWEIHDAHLYEPAAGISDPAEISQKRSVAGKRGATNRWQPDGKANGKPMALPQQSDDKPMAADGKHDGPVPVPEPEEQPPPTPSQARGTKRRRTKCPDIFPVTETMRRFVIERHIPSDAATHETQRFLDYHRAKDSVFADWEAAWRTWMGKVARDLGSQHAAAADETVVRGVGGIVLDEGML